MNYNDEKFEIKDPIRSMKLFNNAKECGKSSSGKSIIIGSTEGNVSVPDKEDIKIGGNVYRKA